MEERQFETAAQVKAKRLRNDALTGNYSVAELANKHNVSLSLAYKILEGKRCCPKGAESIRVCSLRTRKRASVIRLLRCLGFTYNQIGKYLGIGLNTAWQLGQLDVPPNGELTIKLSEQVQSLDGKRIQTGVYRLVSVDADSVMLTADGKSPEFVLTQSLIARIELLCQENESND